MKHPRYKNYKPSGVEWVGEIPKHWKYTRLSHLSSVIDPQPDHRAPELAIGEGFPYIGIRDINFDGTLNFETARQVNEEAVIKQEKAFTVEKRDIVFCKVGTLGFPKFIVNDKRYALSATLVLIKPSDSVDHRYLRLFLDSVAIYAQIDFLSVGATRPALGIEQIRKFVLVEPPLEEQQQIAAFLETETARIDDLIAKQGRLLELLEEKRKALISHAVTKGLDSRVEMKDSRVEWLGEIPSHWEVVQGRYLGQLIGSTETDEDNPRLIKVDVLNDGSSRIELSHPEFPNNLSQQPMIVFPKRGAAIFTNKVKVLRFDVCLDPNVMGWKMALDSNAYFVAYCLSARKLNDIADVSSVPQINNKHIYPLKFPRPPLEEQSRIVAFLDSETAKLDALSAKAGAVIDLLREHRTSLISAAVTGKIDVRKVKELEAV